MLLSDLNRHSLLWTPHIRLVFLLFLDNYSKSFFLICLLLEQLPRDPTQTQCVMYVGINKESVNIHRPKEPEITTEQYTRMDLRTFEGMAILLFALPIFCCHVAFTYGNLLVQLRESYRSLDVLAKDTKDVVIGFVSLLFFLLFSSFFSSFFGI